MIVDNEATQKIVKWVSDNFGDEITVDLPQFDGPLESPFRFNHKSGKFQPLCLQANAMYDPDFFDVMGRCLPIWLTGVIYYDKKHMLCSDCNRDAIHFFTGNHTKMKHKCTDVRRGKSCIWAFIDWSMRMGKRSDKKDADAEPMAD